MTEAERIEKLPPLPWAYTEDRREEMFSIHTEGCDPIDCDNRFLVCGIWYQSSGREHGKAIADFIINSINSKADNERLQQQSYDQCEIISHLEAELKSAQELNRELVGIAKLYVSLKKQILDYLPNNVEEKFELEEIEELINKAK